MNRKLLLPLLMAASIAIAQTPCDSGMAGSYPCNDYDLMSNVPISVLITNTAGGTNTPEGSDSWGWTDPMTGKEYAIIGTTHNTGFVDISDPVNPIFLGYLQRTLGTGTSFWRDVKVYNNHAYIVADNVGAHGVQIFDLTRLRNVTTPPLVFTEDGRYTGVNSCHNIVINEDTGFAYLVGCGGFFSGGPVFLDLKTDPKNPTAAGGYSAEGYTHDAQVVTYNGPDTDHTGKEILIGSNANDVLILDVTDKSNPIKITSFSYPNVGYTHQGWFTEDQKYFILGDEEDESNFGFNTRTLIFDFTDLDNPSLHSTYLGPNSAIDHNLYVKGNLLYESNYSSGLRVIDISGIETIGANTSHNDGDGFDEVGYFDTHAASNATTFNFGSWNVYPFFASGNIIISDIKGGLFVVRQSGTLGLDDQSIGAFKMFPNPAKEKTTLRARNGERIERVEIFSVLGKRVALHPDVNQQEFDIPLGGLSKGIYMVRVNAQLTQKLIVK